MIEVDGADRLAAGLNGAALELGTLEAGHTRAAGIIVRAARPPRLTGRLASSIRARPGAGGAFVEAGAPYAGYVEARTGFLAAAVASSRSEWMAAYRAAVVDVLEGVA